MVKTGEIEQLGENAQKLAIKLKVEGLSHSAIASKLNEAFSAFSANITEDQVAGFIKRNRSKTFKVMKEEKNFDFKMAKYTFNTMDQLKFLNREMWDFFLNVKSNPEYSTKQAICPECDHAFKVSVQTYANVIRAADHILKQIEHQNKLMGRLNDKGITINYNMVDMSKKINVVIPKICHDLERQGVIKILKKKRLRELN